MIAEELYNRGYDAHAYPEHIADDVGNAAFSEVENAVQNRGVTQVAILGYSQGGGATRVFANMLDTNRNAIGAFSINVTAYIDAVRHTGPNAETDMPPSTDYHVNYYQYGGAFELNGAFVDGADYNLDVSTTTWGEDVDHYTIDNDANVRSRIIDGHDGQDGTHDGITDRITR